MEKFVKQSTLEIARLHINRLGMEDRAYRHVYRNSVYHPIRIALVSLVREISSSACFEHPETKRPMVDQSIPLGEVANARYGGAATAARATAKNEIDKAIAEVKIFSRLTVKEISQKWPKHSFPDLPLKRNKTYLFFTDDQFDKLAALTGILHTIDLVMAEMSQSPDAVPNSLDLLPPGVYYDIAVRHS